MILQNYVNIEGNLTKDVELKETKNGIKYCRFSICYNQSYKDENGEYKNIPNFFNVVAWKKCAEFASKCKKGEALSVIGNLKYSEWTNDKNEKRSEIVINAQSVRKFDFSKTEEFSEPEVNPESEIFIPDELFNN